MGTYYLVRHGETTGNKAGRMIGQLDDPLTALGRQQAELAGKALAGVHFDVVFASDLSRARQTAEAILRHQNPECRLVLDRRLREIHGGVYQGRPLTDMRTVWAAIPEEQRFGTIRPSGESSQLHAERVLRAFADICEWYPNGTVAVAAHLAVLRAIVNRVQGIAPGTPGIPVTPIDNCSISVVSNDGGTWKVVKFNDVSHLAGLSAG